jgi:hypothetical protein
MACLSSKDDSIRHFIKVTGTSDNSDAGRTRGSNSSIASLAHPAHCRAYTVPLISWLILKEKLVAFNGVFKLACGL